MQNGSVTQRFELVIERTTRLSQRAAPPTYRPMDWSADCGREDELSTGRL